MSTTETADKRFNKNAFLQDAYRPLWWPPLDITSRGVVTHPTLDGDSPPDGDPPGKNIGQTENDGE